jgi:hypothetical protein
MEQTEESPSTVSLSKEVLLWENLEKTKKEDCRPGHAATIMQLVFSPVLYSVENLLTFKRSNRVWKDVGKSSKSVLGFS